MKTIRFKTKGVERFFTPSQSARLHDEAEDDFMHRSARKAVPAGIDYEIVENIFPAIPTSRESAAVKRGYVMKDNSISLHGTGEVAGQAYQGNPASITSQAESTGIVTGSDRKNREDFCERKVKVKKQKNGKKKKSRQGKKAVLIYITI